MLTLRDSGGSDAGFLLADSSAMVGSPLGAVDVTTLRGGADGGVRGGGGEPLNLVGVPPFELAEAPPSELESDPPLDMAAALTLWVYWPLCGWTDMRRCWKVFGGRWSVLWTGDRWFQMARGGAGRW